MSAEPGDHARTNRTHALRYAALRPETLTITPGHPSVTRWGEYDLDVYFHLFLQGYAKRVHDPQQADLFFVPVYYYWRLPCHPEATTAASFDRLEQRLAELIGKWITAYARRGQRPSQASLVPTRHRSASNNATAPHALAGTSNFFTVTGMLCSCAASHCNPLHKRASLDGWLQVFSYDQLPLRALGQRAGQGYEGERHASWTSGHEQAHVGNELLGGGERTSKPLLGEEDLSGDSLVDAQVASHRLLARQPYIARGVVPYLTQLHSVMPWEAADVRPILALFTGTAKKERACVSCGPCGCPCEGGTGTGCAYTLNSWCNVRGTPKGTRRQRTLTDPSRACSPGCRPLRPALAIQALRHQDNGTRTADGQIAFHWPLVRERG